MDNNTNKVEEQKPTLEPVEVKKDTDKRATVWMVVRVVLIVLGYKLMGIGGIIGAGYIAAMLPKVDKNTVYSKGKKMGLFILHSIIGLAMATIIMLALVLVIRHFDPVAGLDSNIESTYQAPAEYSVYKNENMGISALSYPGSWTVNETAKDRFEINFLSPDQTNDASVALYLLDVGQTVDFKTHGALVTEATNKANTEINYEILKEEIRTVNGKEWLFYDSVTSSKQSDAKVYSQTAVYGTGGSDNRQFYDITTSSVDMEHFGLATSTLSKMVESLRLYN